MPHAFLIAVIFTAYFGLMLAIGCHIAGQVRQHGDSEPEQLPELAPRDEDPGELPAAA